MRPKTEHENRPDQEITHLRAADQPQQPDLTKNPTNSGVKAGRTEPEAGPEAATRKSTARKRKLEDLFDREDLSERIFTDRNLL